MSEEGGGYGTGLGSTRAGVTLVRKSGGGDGPKLGASGGRASKGRGCSRQRVGSLSSLLQATGEEKMWGE